MNGELGAEIREYVDRLVAAAPPLSPAQRIRLAVLLRPDPPAVEFAPRVAARRRKAA
jgi:hypothetical protein